MNIDYKTNKLAKQLTNALAIKKAFGTMAKNVQQRMDDMRDAPTLAALQKIPSARCHALTGNRNGEWAVNISVNHRLIFTINHDEMPVQENDINSINTILVTDIRIEEIEDYH
jgi:plasmid maintenance system killer protein